MVKNYKRLTLRFDFEDRLKKHCRKCELWKKYRSGPMDGKLRYNSYMAMIVGEYLKRADDEDLQEISWDLYIRGLQAHGMTGDLHQVKYVKI